MIRVGIVAEGPSDFLVLKAMMKHACPDVEFEELHPNNPAFSVPGNGWRGVKAWCERNGPRLELLMIGVVGRPLHLIVIHADCSMADKVGSERPCPEAADTANALKAVVEGVWLGRDPRPEFVVVATPAQSSDAWVVATFDPPFANLANIECDKAVEEEFVRRYRWRRRDGQVKKSTSAYRPLAEMIGPHHDLVRTRCPQAEVFRTNFLTAVARVSPPSP